MHPMFLTYIISILVTIKKSFSNFDVILNNYLKFCIYNLYISESNIIQYVINNIQKYVFGHCTNIQSDRAERIKFHLKEFQI